MKTMTLEEFHAAIKAQQVGAEDWAFICPMCGYIQSARDLIAAGAGEDFAAVESVLAFSCVGRWTGAGTPRGSKQPGPCNWTLGGLCHTQKLEVITPDGEHHPRFEPATPEQAREHTTKFVVR
jgi:hypothetical protein